jgi:hypothetical protein
MRRLFRVFDESEALSQFIERLSIALAARRGIPMLAGVGFILLSFLCMGVVLFGLVLADKVASIWLLLCCPFALLYIGLIAGFLGFMLSTPLGEGYRNQ